LSARFGTLKNQNDINNFSNANIINSNINNILIGCLSGYAHIGKCINDKAFITFEQTIKHKDYMIFLYKNLKDNGINLYDIKYYTIKDSRYNSINNSIYFKTYNLELLKPLANMFLTENNNKIVPLYIECHLNPIFLAY
jgi:LAGLIDADG DNA endonuclease family